MWFISLIFRCSLHLPTFQTLLNYSTVEWTAESRVWPSTTKSISLSELIKRTKLLKESVGQGDSVLQRETHVSDPQERRIAWTILHIFRLPRKRSYILFSLSFIFFPWSIYEEVNSSFCWVIRCLGECYLDPELKATVEYTSYIRFHLYKVSDNRREIKYMHSA